MPLKAPLISPQPANFRENNWHAWIPTCTHRGHPLTIDTSAWPENVNLPFRVGQGEGQRESTTTNTRWVTASRAIMPVLLGSDMSSLGASLLRGPWPSPSTLQASALWSDQTTVIYAIRRMG
jgi:hypothetical protein